MAINFWQRLNLQSSQFHNFVFDLKICSDEKPFVYKDTFCHNWLAGNVIASTSKRIDREFSEPTKLILRMWYGILQIVKMSVINSGESPCKYRLLSWCIDVGFTN